VLGEQQGRVRARAAPGSVTAGRGSYSTRTASAASAASSP
jgi:hypothetical protein